MLGGGGLVGGLMMHRHMAHGLFRVLEEGVMRTY